jgi:predicted CoA-binding protein
MGAMEQRMKSVVVLGASPKRDRYSNQAVRMLREYGHTVIPVNPGHDFIEGLPVTRRLGEIRSPVDTVTVYLSPQHGETLAEQILRLEPKRVILNPGAESTVLEKALCQRGIEVVHGCTLVMLRTAQF